MEAIIKDSFFSETERNIKWYKGINFLGNF